MKDKSILEEAADIRSGSRDADYGDAVKNFENISTVATILSGNTLTALDCVCVQMATKICREGHKHKRDNLVDLCGYSEIKQLIEESTSGFLVPAPWKDIERSIVSILKDNFNIDPETSHQGMVLSLFLDTPEVVAFLVLVEQEFNISIPHKEQWTDMTLKEIVDAVCCRVGPNKKTIKTQDRNESEICEIQ